MAEEAKEGKQGNTQEIALIDKNDGEERPIKKPTLHINYIYRAHEYVGTSHKEQMIAYKKPKMVASVNKPLLIDGNIIMFSDPDLEQVCTLYDDAFFITL